MLHRLAVSNNVTAASTTTTTTSRPPELAVLPDQWNRPVHVPFKVDEFISFCVINYYMWNKYITQNIPTRVSSLCVPNTSEPYAMQWRCTSKDHCIRSMGLCKMQWVYRGTSPITTFLWSYYMFSKCISCSTSLKKHLLQIHCLYAWFVCAIYLPFSNSPQLTSVAASVKDSNPGHYCSYFIHDDRLYVCLKHKAFDVSYTSVNEARLSLTDDEFASFTFYRTIYWKKW
jgi:hypothetical protein